MKFKFYYLHVFSVLDFSRFTFVCCRGGRLKKQMHGLLRLLLLHFAVGTWEFETRIRTRGPQLKFTLKSNLIFFTFRPFFSLFYFFSFFFFVSFSSLFLLNFPFFLTFLHLLLLSLIFFPFSHFFIFTSPTGKPLAADDRHWLNHIVRAGVSSMTKLAIKPNH